MYLIFYILTIIFGILVIPSDLITKTIFSFLLTNAFFGFLMALIQPKSLGEFNKYYEIETCIISTDIVLMAIIPFVCMYKIINAKN